VNAKEALIASCLLYSQIVDHVKAGRPTSEQTRIPYRFWVQQHRLEELVNYIKDSTSRLDESSYPRGVLESSTSAVSELFLSALNIVLQEVAMQQLSGAVENTQWLPNETRQGRIRLAADTARHSVASICRHLEAPGKLDQVNEGMFVPLVVYVALQSRIRQLRRDAVPADPAESLPLRSIATSNLESGQASVTTPKYTLQHAMMLDEIIALRAKLRQWACKSSLAQFLSSEIAVEFTSDADSLQQRDVGLTDFAYVQAHLHGIPSAGFACNSA
jgi:hypothetical protein